MGALISVSGTSPQGRLHAQLKPLTCRPNHAGQVTFGDFPAFICLASLLLEFVIGNAVVARGFSTYLVSQVQIVSESNRFRGPGGRTALASVPLAARL